MKKRYNNLFAILVKPYMGRLVVVFFFNILSVLLSILVFMMIEPIVKVLFQGSTEGLSPISAFVLQHLSQYVTFDTSKRAMMVFIIFTLFVYFFKSLCYYISQWLMAHVRSHLIASLRQRMYGKIIRLSLGNVQSQRRGDLVSRAVNDTQEVEFTVVTAIRQFMTEPIAILIYFGVLLYISPKLTLISMVLLPISFFLITWITSPLRANARTSKQRLGSLLAHVEETISGLRIVKSLNIFSYFREKFHDYNDSFTRTQKTIYRQVDLASPLSEFLSVTVVMIVLVIGGTMALQHSNSLTPALFIAYIALVSQLLTPAKNLSGALASYRRGLSAFDRLQEIFDMDEIVQEAADAADVSDFREQIALNDVTFRYEEKDVLTHVDIAIRKGQFVALVGESGSGKSTIADLLMRFYDPVAGQVLLDGRDIKHYTLASYRSLFGFVSQDVVLFNDTLYNNIVMGLEGVTEQQVEDALRVANIYDFVVGLPDGLQHALTDRGLNLSGGQRQRISIARAVLRNAPVLILDEATSAMDTQSEKAVMQAIDNLRKDHTLLMIAHRLSTVRNADLIYVLDEGRVVQCGTHEHLKEVEGKYKYLLEINQF